MARAEEARSGPVRCAIYTRKSTEEGLEQSFNSLDAQREACEAYVISQRHEGWTLSPVPYDDGGFSGGTLDRPALRQLLADVQSGKVDVIVVYKVDRLTRSLADFAKIVEILDAAKASFVSVTQSFNTTSSMGRLTLNVLLSFAQFEREVTGERIRDKVAQSKARGLWMGGNIPLGYVIEDRKLKVVEAEADKVRTIYRRYLALGSVAALADALDDAGIMSQTRTSNAGRALGGKPFTKGALYHILKNRIYVGEVSHKGKPFPGAHEGIIDPDVFAQVQALLNHNAVNRRSGQQSEAPSVLAYLVWDGLGRRMSPNHAQKAKTRYRYYASRLAAAMIARRPYGACRRLILKRSSSARLGTICSIMRRSGTLRKQSPLIRPSYSGCLIDRRCWPTRLGPLTRSRSAASSRRSSSA
jgi:site-specific DNA recombinase